MTKLLFIPALSLACSCNQDVNAHKAHQHKYNKSASFLANASSAHSSLNTKRINQKKLIGVWALTRGADAVFEISKNSIYYPAHEASYPYTIAGDSVKIKYDDFDASFAVKFVSDDVLTLTGDDGKNIYYRIK